MVSLTFSDRWIYLRLKEDVDFLILTRATVGAPRIRKWF